MAKQPQGTAALVAAIDVRLQEIGDDCDALTVEIKRARSGLAELETDLRFLRDERRMLGDLRKMYLDESSAERHEVLIGPTEAIRTLLQNEPDHRARAQDVVERVVLAVESKVVRTESSDPRKLISSIIGQMVRNGQLTRDGEYVALRNGHAEGT
jgi:hypothetical protein